MTLFSDEVSFLGIFVVMHVAGMLLGLSVGAAADLLGLGILIGRIRVSGRVFSRLHTTMAIAIVMLLFSGCGLIVMRGGSWCSLDSASIVQVGPICLPDKLIAKLVLMAALVGVAMLIDSYLMPLSRRSERPLLLHLSLTEIVRLSFIVSASLTCWWSLATIALIKSVHTWSFIALVGRCMLVWVTLATLASVTLIVLRLAFEILGRPNTRGHAIGDAGLWTHAPVATDVFRANVVPLFSGVRRRSTPPPLPGSARTDVAATAKGEPATFDAAMSACRRAIFGTAGISFVINVLMLAGPLYMLQIYDRVLTSRNIETLLVLTLLLVGLYACMGILDAIRGRVLGRVALRLDRLVGPRLFTGFVGSPHKPNKSTRQQPLRDLEQIRQFLSGPSPVAMFDLPWSPLYLLLIFLLHPTLGAVALVGAVVLVALSLLTQLMTRQPLMQAAHEIACAHALVEAGQRSSETLRAMAMVVKHRDRWAGEHRAALSRQLRAEDVAGGFSVATKVGRLLLQSLVLGAGAYLALNEAMSAGAMIAASIIATRALAPVEQLIAQWRGLVATWSALQRCRTNLENSGPAATYLALPDPVGCLEVSKLYVTAPGRTEPVLKGVDFALEPGDALAVLGPSAAGKSTLARALVGVCAARHGEVRLDGAALAQWDPEHLGRHVGYLPQDVSMFDGTIAENIARLDPSPNDQAVLAAAAMANVHQTVLRLEHGYQTRVSEGGMALSGGQRQRIALARALYGDPALIVLDEPNANLDAAGVTALVAAIRKIRAARRTVVVVAHNQNILVAVNRLLVLNGGRQIAFGEKTVVLRQMGVSSRLRNEKEARNADIGTARGTS